MKVTTLAAALVLALVVSPGVSAQTTTSPSGASPSSTTQPQWYKSQGPEIRASKLVGTTVRNNANETIGEINELILDKDGKVVAAVIGVGGFLGIGERDVAVDFKSLRLEQDGSSTVVKIDATKDTMKNAPEWKWSSDRSGTTGKSTPPSTK